MKYEIRSVNIYYYDLDKLIKKCVTPEMEKWSSDLDLWFWERGCIGGRHLKVRWVQKDESENIKESLFDGVNNFLKANPSPPPQVSYNEEAGKKLAKTERRQVSEEELVFRIDEIKSFPYERVPDKDSSEETIDILHHFLHDTRELCTENLSPEINKLALVMRLMTIFALEQFDNIEEGCIGFRAHWDNYEHWFKPAVLAQRIKQHYDLNKTGIQKIIQNILDLHKKDELKKNRDFAVWINILRKYRAMVYKLQLAGVTLISEPINQKDVIETETLLKNDGADSRSKQFLSKLYEQTNYLGRLADMEGLQMTRITINLIYHFFSNLGISSFERMSCSYFVHRSVEDLHNVDLMDVLEVHMKKVLGDQFIGTAENSEKPAI